ncbi:MAG TPA: cation:proton antiporter, partial [Bryobacteraceae bacterium]|nr:cation:proton antiporter [Bryobacteraceae bacterium]
VFVLNVLAFILVGFQLKSIAARSTGAIGARYAGIAAVVCVAAIVARIVWVTGAAAFSRWRCRPRLNGTPGPHDAVALTPRAAAVVGWCGMRGTVTLAAALALPTGSDGGILFPYRDLIVVAAFGVVLGTLVVQGLTLRPLLLHLRLEDDGMVDREVSFARVEALRAAIEAAVACPGAETTSLLRHRYEFQLRRAEMELAGNGVGGNGGVPEDGVPTSERAMGCEMPDADAAVARAATTAQRRRLVALRADGSIGDAAFQLVEEELDRAELDLAHLLRAGQRTGREG